MTCMASKFQYVLLFAFLLVYQETMGVPAEAALCESPSRLFVGLCFSDRNCASICVEEKFTSGRCKHLKCICSKDCNGGGGGGGPPGEGPPGSGGSPGYEPPGEGPPGGGGSPGYEPPSEGPSGGGGCPGYGPPGDDPPGDGGSPGGGPPCEGPPDGEGPPGYPPGEQKPTVVNRKALLLS